MPGLLEAAKNNIAAGPTAAVQPVAPLPSSTSADTLTEEGFQEEPATPEEQEEYERVSGAVTELLFSNRQASDTIIKAIDPNNKVGSTAQASLIVLSKIDESLNMDETVVAPVIMDIVSSVVELAETAHSMEYSDVEMEQLVAVTWEYVVQMYGGEEAIEPEYNDLTAGMSENDLTTVGSKYRELTDATAGLEDPMAAAGMSPSQQAPGMGGPVGPPVAGQGGQNIG